jgi:hypothetical protein
MCSGNNIWAVENGTLGSNNLGSRPKFKYTKSGKSVKNNGVNQIYAYNYDQVKLIGIIKLQTLLVAKRKVIIPETAETES